MFVYRLLIIVTYLNSRSGDSNEDNFVGIYDFMVNIVLLLTMIAASKQQLS